MEKVRTKGNVIVNDIKIGDVHYEYSHGRCVKSEVISLPTVDDGYWSWESKGLGSVGIIKYGVREGMSHYAPKLYDYPAYTIPDENYI